MISNILKVYLSIHIECENTRPRLVSCLRVMKPSYSRHNEIVLTTYKCVFMINSDDSSVKVWTVGRDMPDITLSGHQSDVRCVDWHPYRSLIVSGSRENIIKLWDPKQAACVSNISSHKKSILCCKWNLNGNWLATGAKDGLVKIFDIRVMKEMENLRGHNSDVCSLQWHPQHETLLLSGEFYIHHRQKLLSVTSGFLRQLTHLVVGVRIVLSMCR